MSNELLLQILHKQDLIITALKHKGISIQDLVSINESEGEPCPVCNKQTRYYTMPSGLASRRCGCRLPITEFIKDTPNAKTTSKDPVQLLYPTDN